MDPILQVFLVSIGINVVMFLPAYIFRTDKLTDISYSLTFAVVVVFLYNQGPKTTQDAILLFMVLLWAFRLGGYLLRRITVIGKDKRFDGMREDLKRFSLFWIFQGFTVFIVMLPATLYAGSDYRESGVLMWVGFCVFLFGWIVETLADQQKFAFIGNTENKGKWVDSGLWKIIRHPNYLGEILVWTGIYFYTFSALDLNGAVAGALSPVYIFLVLRYFSGIPLLQLSAEEKWGNDPEYQAYYAKTGLLLPKGTLPMVSFIVLSQAAGLIGALFTFTGVGSWYQYINKPTWNPPGWVFGPVWTTLYLLMGIAAYLVWRRRSLTNIRPAITYFGIQLFLNSLWSFIFFGQENPGLAFIEILILLTVIILTTVKFYQIDKKAGWLFVPYIVWVSFASVLNYTIWTLN